jgi:iduronate 2-sulfatase
VRASLGLAALGLLVACGGKPAAPPSPASKAPEAAAPEPARRLAAGSRPNILLIVSDDLAAAALSIYGNPLVKTPAVEKLAARGVTFDRAYCQYPICNPSRTSFLSGRRPATTRVLDNRTRPDSRLPRAAFLPNELRRQGYWTFRAGKVFHDNTWEEIGDWDYYARINSPVPPPGQPVAPDPKGPLPEPVATGGEAGLELLTKPTPIPNKEKERLRDRRIADHTARQIKKAKNRGRAFFAAVGFNRPHLPFAVPRPYFNLYPPEAMVLPAAAAPGAPAVPERALAGRRFAPTMTEAQQRAAIAGYYASVSFMDAQLEILLRTLDKLELWDSTIVVLTADHGFHLGEHGLWGKLSLYEEVVRVPLIVVAPGIPGGRRSARPVELVDLYPTLVELAGLEAPADLEGQSFAPQLRDPDAPRTRPATTRLELTGLTTKTAWSTTDGRWRYTEWGSPAEAELYDLEADPRQQRNLANDPKWQAERQRMAELLARSRS